MTPPGTSDIISVGAFEQKSSPPKAGPKKGRKPQQRGVMSYNAELRPGAGRLATAPKKKTAFRFEGTKHPALPRGVLNPFVYLAFTILALEISPFLSKK